MLIKRLAVALAVSMSLVALAVAQTSEEPKLPDTPAGRTLSAFITAFNSGDLKTIARFHSERGGDEGHAQEDLNFFNQSGGLKVTNVISSSDYEIETLTQAKKDGRWLRFKMRVGQTAPHPPVEIGVQPAAGPNDTQPRKESVPEKPERTPVARNMTDAQIASSLGAYLDELASADKFSGVVLIAKDGKPIFEKAYGLADKTRKIPTNLETKFNLGSMNKMFTSVAVAQLAQAGKLSFDDTVGKHLPDYPNKDVASKVTIHHLLTHTSGLRSYWNAKFDAKKGSIKTVSDYLALFADEPFTGEPGKRFLYSNSGFIVLGAIIEKVSGQNYYDYVKQHIYKPAGMTHTDAYEMTADTPNLAMGYTTEDQAQGQRRENTGSRPNRGGPAGGGYSTVGDLLKFHIALRDHKLLNQKYTELITTGKVEMGRAKYAYGFGDELINGKRIFGHNGGAPGIGSDLSIYPELGYTSVVMTNYDPPLMMPVVRRIREMITQTR